MGTNTLNNITAPNLISVDDVNQYFTSNTGDFYPRNASSGAIEDSAHSLGSAATQWKNIYSNNIIINGTLFDPDASGAGIDATNAIVSGATRTGSGQPDFLRASGAGASMTILATTTNLAITANTTSIVVASDIAVSSLTVAPAANNTCLVNDTQLAGAASTKYTGEHESDPISIDTVGTEISDRIGEYICLKGTAEYMLAYVEDATTLRHIKRGYFFDSSGAPIVREVKSNNDTLTIMSLGWVFMDADGVTVDVTYTSPIYNTTEPSSPVTDDYWFDLVSRLWKRYDGAAYQEVDRIPVGLVVVDGTNAVATRSFDFTRAFSDISSIEIEVESVTKARSNAGKNVISVYAQTNTYNAAPLDWDITTDLESGLTEAASTTYYLYITEQGAPKIATERPYDRLSDLKGYYHPYHSWRYVGDVYNNSVSNIIYSSNNSFEKSGAIVKIREQIASGVTSVDFGVTDLNARFSKYLVKMESVVTASATDITLRIGIAGVIKSDAQYRYSTQETADSGSTTGLANSSTNNIADTKFIISATSVGRGLVTNDADASLGGSIELHDIHNTARYTNIEWKTTHENAIVTHRAIGGGVYGSSAGNTNPIDTIRILATTGNISGKFTLYGWN